MPKILSVALLASMICACTSAPPKPPLDKGEWTPLPLKTSVVASPSPAPTR